MGGVGWGGRNFSGKRKRLNKLTVQDLKLSGSKFWVNLFDVKSKISIANFSILNSGKYTFDVNDGVGKGPISLGNRSGRRLPGRGGAGEGGGRRRRCMRVTDTDHRRNNTSLLWLVLLPLTSPVIKVIVF